VKRLLIVCAAGALVTGCASGMRDTGPSIGDLQRGERQPRPEDLIVEPSRPIPASPELALENYRRILELRPDSETRAEAVRRMADLQVELDDIDPGEMSQSRLANAVQLYQQLLRDRPNDPGNDRVLYQLARALQNQGNIDESVRVLERLARDYPNSPYSADGRFRRAELLFSQQRFDEAASEYEAVLALRQQTPFFEASEYKYAWTLYNLARYDDAVEVTYAILDRELPAGELSDPDAALAKVSSAKRDLARDVLRVNSLSYATLGGGDAVNESFDRRGTPAYYPMIYRALGTLLLERERYSDTAGAYAAFIRRHGDHPLAPEFQSRVIAAYDDGGFPEQVIDEKQRYIETYDPRATYWAGGAATDTVLAELRTHLDDLSAFYHARAQTQERTRELPTPQQDYLTAAGLYQRTLEIYPNAADAPQVNFLYGETLYSGGRIAEAAEQYTRTAYDYAPHGRSAEAGYAAVLAYHQIADTAGATDPSTRPPALSRAVEESLRFADTFTNHPQRLYALTRTAEDLFELREYDEAIVVATRVLNNQPQPNADLRRTALSVRADAEFTQARFAEAEASYIALAPLLAADPGERSRVSEQLAISIYRQGEAAREAGNAESAVAQFLRIGVAVPNASIRASAEYDAAAVLLEIEDWTGAARVLEGFRARYPQHELLPDADKRLAIAYERDGNPARAAVTYARISERASETPDVRREAAWKAATLHDEAGDRNAASGAYERYLNTYPGASDEANEARERLLALHRQDRDPERYRFWLRQAVTAGASGDDRARLLAAQSSLALGQIAAADARAVALRQPIQTSVQRRRDAVQRAADELGRAAGFGFAEVTTEATYELGRLYQAFAQALLESERPRGLDEFALDEYVLLLEEQAFPLEERAIEFHETNLKRILQDIYDEPVRNSYRALLDIAPGRYGKRAQLEDFHDAIR
jgi:TolA-binding protein